MKAMQKNTLVEKDNMENKIYVGWNEIEKLVDNLCYHINYEHPEIKYVHGLKRGGYIPAVMLSHQLNLPYSEVVLKDTLVVDDICDSGETLKNAPKENHTKKVKSRVYSVHVYGQRTHK